MDKFSPYSDVEIAEIASGELLPKRNKFRAMEFAAGPSKLLTDHSWIHKTVEELEKEGRIDTEGFWKDNPGFDGELKCMCHFNMELSEETKLKLLNAINTVLEKKKQEIFNHPYTVEVTKGDDDDSVKFRILFDPFVVYTDKADKIEEEQYKQAEKIEEAQWNNTHITNGGTND